LSETLKRIEEAISLSKALIKLAEEQDWEKFAELETSRQALIAKIDTQTVNDPHLQNAVRLLLNELIELNRQLETRCSAERDQIVSQMKSLHQSKKASSAYTET